MAVWLRRTLIVVAVLACAGSLLIAAGYAADGRWARAVLNLVLAVGWPVIFWGLLRGTGTSHEAGPDAGDD